VANILVANIGQLGGGEKSKDYKEYVTPQGVTKIAITESSLICFKACQ